MKGQRRTYIHGIIAAERPQRFGLAGLSPRGEEVHTVVEQALSAVVSGYEGDDFGNLGPENVVRSLLAHQEVVERVMAGHTVLPVKFGTVVANEDEVRCLLGQGRKRLTEALARLEGKVEVEVVATWDLRKVLEEIAQEEEITRLRETLATSPASAARGLQIQAGKLVKTSLDKRRGRCREQIVTFLAETALDIQPNGLIAEEMVANVAFLLSGEREQEFESRVRLLDGFFGDGVHFRLIGPLPPYSFSTAEVIRPDPARIEEARRRLGLGAEVTLKEVKEAYRRLAAQHHPDARPGDGRAEGQFLQVRRAFTLLSAYCRGQAEGANGDGQRYSLQPGAVAQAFLVEIRRAALLGGEQSETEDSYAVATRPAQSGAVPLLHH